MHKQYHTLFMGPYICSKCLKTMQGNNKLQIQKSIYICGDRETELGYTGDLSCYFLIFSFLS